LSRSRKSTVARIGQHGPYWLSKRTGSANWHLTYYDEQRRKTVQESLGTTDTAAAEAQVVAHYLATLPNNKPLKEEEATFHSVLDLYYETYGKKLASAGDVKLSIKYWKEAIGPTVTLDKVTIGLVEAFIEQLRGLGFSEGYISRILSVARAAVKRALRTGKISVAPFIPDNENRRQKLNKKPKGRPLELREMAILFLCADPAHLRVFMSLMINTLCRPDAALDLGPAQIDLDKGVIFLNPEDRAQTNKFRPAVPITTGVRPIVEGCPAEAFVNVDGHKIGEIKKAWRTMVRRSGLPNADRIKPYSIRHTMGRELRAGGASGEDVSLFLGHIPVGANEVTSVYSPYDPNYLKKAVTIIEAYWDRLRWEVEKQAAVFTPPPLQPGKRNDLLQNAA